MKVIRVFSGNIKKGHTYLNRFDPFMWWCSELDLVKLANRMLPLHKFDPQSLSKMIFCYIDQNRANFLNFFLEINHEIIIRQLKKVGQGSSLPLRCWLGRLCGAFSIWSSAELSGQSTAASSEIHSQQLHWYYIISTKIRPSITFYRGQRHKWEFGVLSVYPVFALLKVQKLQMCSTYVKQIM